MTTREACSPIECCTNWEMNKFPSVISNANDLLLYNKFEECVQLCCKGISELQHVIENPCALETQEALVVIAIQAYAELDRWQEVLPLVNQTYSNIEECPQKVAQLCILLHAEVRDYPTCSALANIWLHNPTNYAHSNYSELVEVYVSNVLIPNLRWDDVAGFLEGCKGLTKEKTESYLKVMRTLRGQWEQDRAEEIEVVDREEAGSSPMDPDMLSGVSTREELDRDPDDQLTQRQLRKSAKQQNENASFIQHYIVRLKNWVTRNVPYIGWYIIQNLSMISLLVYILLTQGHYDMLSWQTWHRIWSAIRRLWRAMFAPFHMVNK